jgi:hypothetical protein
MIVTACYILTGSPEILKILLRDESLSPEVDLKTLARDTPTFSGSDLKRKSRSVFGSASCIFDPFLLPPRRMCICGTRCSQGECLGTMGR